MTCEVAFIAPYDLSQYITYTNIETETTPAPFDPLLSYLKHSSCTYSGAVWRFLGDESTAVGKYPSDGRVANEFFAPLSDKIKGRAYIQKWNSSHIFQKDELGYKKEYVGGWIYYRYKSKVTGNKNNPMPSGNSDNTHWEFIDNLRDMYTYLPIHNTDQDWDVGDVVWVPLAQYASHPTHKYLYGRAWIAISSVPEAETSPDNYPPDLVTPPLLNVEDVRDVDEQFWEFVRLTSPNNLSDVSPYTQSVEDDEIFIALSINKPLTDVIPINADADSITYKATETVNDDIIHEETYSMVKPITRLYEFRQPRTLLNTKHITDIPFYPSTDHEITITKTGDVAKLGALIMGQRFTLGDMKINSSSGGSSFSSIDTDNFETLGFKSGKGTDNRDLIIHVPDGNYNRVLEYMEKAKGNIIYVITPDGYEKMGGLARLADFNFLIQLADYHVLSVHLEGITDYGN